MGGETSASDESNDTRLGVSARLGLPLPPPSRGVVLRLPPPPMRLAGQVPLADAPLPESQHVLAIPVVQSGRVRITHLLEHGLAWGTGDLLTTERIRLGSGAGSLPALLVQPSLGGRLKVNSEQRLTIPAAERTYLGIAADGAEVLLAMRIHDPSRVLIVGAPALSLLLQLVWTDEVR